MNKKELLAKLIFSPAAKTIGRNLTILNKPNCPIIPISTDKKGAGNEGRSV